MSRPKKILLSGRPGIGKTTVIRKIASRLGAAARGFYTQELREKNRRVGFEVNPLGARPGTFAHVDFQTPYRVGKYRVDLEVLEKVGVQALEQALERGQVVVIDEIGKMELHSRRFRQVVLRVMESDCPVIATVTRRDTAFTRRLKEHPGAVLLEVTRENRDELPEEVLEMLG